ncbi:hypothetical protein U9M48_027357 [Paspalum notatum var. saurae]|uniref:Uncharacterized protein n=1 Tax=Paspalum notatum var. saurae TaxID=547442 RepID=A0AAQ3X022_PASNO
MRPTRRSLQRNVGRPVRPSFRRRQGCSFAPYHLPRHVAGTPPTKNARHVEKGRGGERRYRGARILVIWGVRVPFRILRDRSSFRRHRCRGFSGFHPSNIRDRGVYRRPLLLAKPPPPTLVPNSSSSDGPDDPARVPCRPAFLSSIPSQDEVLSMLLYMHSHGSPLTTIRASTPLLALFNDEDGDGGCQWSKPADTMRKAKRHSGDLSRSFHKKRRTCKTEWVSGHLRDGDSNQDVFTKLSDPVQSFISKSVISISLCNGGITLFSCSGIAIGCQGCLSRFLTSASLATAFYGKTNENYDDLKIEVRSEGKEVYMGFLAEYDLDHNFAVVNIDACMMFLLKLSNLCQNLCPMWKNSFPTMGHSFQVSGVSLDIRSVSKGDRSCTAKKLEGLQDLAPFVYYCIGLINFISGPAVTSVLQQCFQIATRILVAQAPTRDLNHEQLDLESLGYPKLPSTMGARMILVNTFEETFGDIRESGAGGKRFFACTGFCIRWNGSTVILTSASLIGNSSDGNKIVEDLKIEVLLPHKKSRERVPGMLEHYNLHYNIALVSVKDHCALCPANALYDWFNLSEVAAVGHCFESGALMATGGKLVSWTGTLDCDCLAGIGGPVVNMDGDVLGMNFYDKKKGTPFLLWPDICEILSSFEEKSDPSGVPFWEMDGDDTTRLNRWPVPMPCWSPPKDKSDDDVGLEHKYDYMK